MIVFPLSLSLSPTLKRPVYNQAFFPKGSAGLGRLSASAVVPRPGLLSSAPGVQGEPHVAVTCTFY